jgi:hypothetical protein
MIDTMTPTTATCERTATDLGWGGTAFVREQRSTTAPSSGSVHGTGLPFAGSALVIADAVAAAARNRMKDAALQAYVPGSPPRGGPV